MDNDFDSFEGEEYEFLLSKKDAQKIDDGLNASATVLTAIGAVIVAIVGLVKFFSKDDKENEDN